MPVTERLWDWDHFLQGGNDFELNTILFLSFLCLVLVLSKHGKHCVDLLFAIWYRVAFISTRCHFVRVMLAGSFSTSSKDRRFSPASVIKHLPLRI